MKRLLFKLFPKFFGVCVHYNVDFEKVKRDNCLQLAIVDPGHQSVSGVLGISNERASFLAEIAVKKFHEHNEMIKAIDDANKYCNHINEHTWITIVISSAKASQMNPIVKFLGSM